MIGRVGLRLALVASLTSWAAAQTPRLELESELLEFGTVVSGATKTVSVELRNAGDGDLLISRVIANCGCVKPALIVDDRVVTPRISPEGGEPVRLAPGAAARMDVEINATGRSGELVKQVRVFSDDPDRMVAIVTVRALCDPGYTVTPKVLDFEEPVISGNTATRSVLLKPTGVWRGAITGAVYRVPGVTVKWQGVDGTTSTRIEVTIGEAAPVGHLLWPVELTTDSEAIPRILIPVRAEVAPVVQLSGPDPKQPRILDFGVFGRGEEVTLEAQVVNHDGSVPYRIRRVVIDGPQGRHLDAEVITNKDGVATALRLTVRSSLKARVLRGAVRLESDHPAVPALQLPFRGRVKSK